MCVPQGFDHLLAHGSGAPKSSSLLVGAPGQRRQDLVRNVLRAELDLELVGTFWPDVFAPEPHLEMNGSDLPQSAVAAMTTNARVCLNARWAPNTGINPRAFEIAARVVLVTDDQAIDDMFEPGSEALVWESLDQAVELLQEANMNRSATEKVASSGQRRAFADHTLAHRFKFLLNEWDLFK